MDFADRRYPVILAFSYSLLANVYLWAVLIGLMAIEAS
jgi:hypothetical protein